MSSIRRLFCAALACVTLHMSPTFADADFDADFEVNSNGMSVRAMIGRTLVGVTRENSRVFSVYLGRDGKAEFHNSGGKRATATWELLDKYILCFTGLVENNPNERVCKRAPENGRGMDWMTVILTTENGNTTWAKETKDEHRGSSQMVYSFDGKVEVDQNSYVSEVTNWAGHLIVGRTLKDREAWFARLSLDGSLDFVFASGKRFEGRYTLKPGEVCLEFPSSPDLSGCRKPTIKDKKIIWASSKDGSASSELVFMKKLESEGPREIAVLSTRGHRYLVQSPDYRYLVTATPDRDAVTLWHAASGRSLGEISQIDYDAIADIEFSPDGQRLAVARAEGVEFFDTGTGAVTAVLERPAGQPDFGEVAFGAEPDQVLIGHVNGEVSRYDLASGTRTMFRMFSALSSTRIADIAVSSNGMIGVADMAGRIGLLGSDLTDIPDRSMQAGGHFSDTAFAGESFVAASADERIYLIPTTGNSPNRSTEILSGLVGRLSPNPVGDGVLVSLGRDLGFMTIPDLKLTEKWEVAEDTIYYVNSVLNGNGMVYLDKARKLAYWARDSATAQQFLIATDTSSSPARVAHNELATRFSDGRKEADRLEASDFRAATAQFNIGNCTDYAQLRPALRLQYRRADCEEVAVTRALGAEFTAAVAALNCDEAERLSSQLPNTELRVKACRDKVARAAEERAYVAAKESGDCETVRSLAASFKEPEAGADCDLAQSMKSDSPRRMFLAAVQLDTAGDRARARTLYTEVMTRFPDDDLALDAATRLTALADLATIEKQQAEQTAAIKAAEDRARAAENAARKAEEEAEMRRIAREEEARRADQARRDAEAEAERARQAAQPTRNTACDHVTPGMRFTVEGGGFFGIGDAYYSVIGISREGGIVTARMVGSDIQKQFSCYSVN